MRTVWKTWTSWDGGRGYWWFDAWMITWAWIGQLYAYERRLYMSCTCDFCMGRKRWADNWCPCCGEVRLVAPNWWENLDVCPACEVRLMGEHG